MTSDHCYDSVLLNDCTKSNIAQWPRFADQSAESVFVDSGRLGLTDRHTPYGPYGCRHTWITRALDNDDLSIQDVAEMVGTSVRQIGRTYKTVGRRHKKLAGLADKVHRNSENIE